MGNAHDGAKILPVSVPGVFPKADLPSGFHGFSDMRQTLNYVFRVDSRAPQTVSRFESAIVEAANLGNSDGR